MRLLGATRGSWAATESGDMLVSGEACGHRAHHFQRGTRLRLELDTNTHVLRVVVGGVLTHSWSGIPSGVCFGLGGADGARFRLVSTHLLTHLAQEPRVGECVAAREVNAGPWRPALVVARPSTF